MVKTELKGSVLAFTLIVVTLALLLVGALLTSGQRSGNLIFEGHSGVQKQALAKAAINRLIQHLQFDQAYQSDLSWVSSNGNESYQIVFDTSRPRYSTNNLGGGLAQNSSLSGVPVPAGTLEAIAQVRTGTSQANYRFVLGNGFGTLASFGTNGAIHFGRDVTFSSVTSLSDPTPSEFAIVANSRTQGITYSASPGTFTVGPEARMRSAGPIDSQIQSSFPSANNWQESAPPQPVPQVQVDALVTAASSHVPPVFNAQGNLLVRGDTYMTGPVTINGSVDLADGTLYVNGDITINGGVNGFGSLYCDGDVSIQGGSAAISTNSRSGAAVYADGNITFTGLSAAQYLNSLALSNPTLGAAWTDFQSGYNYLATIAAHPTPGTYTTPPGFFSIYGLTSPSTQLGWLYDMVNPSAVMFAARPHARDLFVGKMMLGPGYSAANFELMPRHGPNGIQSGWHDDSYSRRMRDELASLPGAATDPRLGQLIRAFEDIGYIFRHDFQTVASGLPQWDSTMPTFDHTEISFDQLLWLVNGYDGLQYFAAGLPGTAPPNSPTNYFAFDQDRGRENYQTLFLHNPPLDFSWLGKGYFQGVLYSNGNITLENDATVLGAIMCEGDLSLTDGTEFTYNKEYEDLFQTGTGPVRVRSYSKI